MRLQSVLKQLWKSIEVAASTQPVGTAKPQTKSQPAVATDSFVAAGSKAAKPYGGLQGRLNGTPAPKFGNEQAAKLVENLYRGALGRELDPLGRQTWVPLVEQGRLSEVIDAVVQSHEFRTHRAPGTDVKSLSADLYTGILGRTADPEGNAGTQHAINRGQLAHRLYDILLSAEHRAVLERTPAPPAAPTPAPTPTPAPVPTPAPQLPKEPGQALSTVPLRPEYAAIPLDMKSPEAALFSAAKWVRENKPEFFDKGDDRQVAYEMMTWVIGSLRAHGIDAHRVVNHPSHAMGVGVRYGSDALVMPDKTIFDVYAAWGDPGRGDPHLLNVGKYADGRLRE